jgi:WD40 repeat protein/tRNA A-37 threonylcarbamoyl transferase component Bud32
VLGRFVLLQEVGSGRFGSVWKAHDPQLQRHVAVKIPRERYMDPHETELFLRDARAAAQLKHPRIASVHEVGRQNDTVYIVTDLIEGANLHEWLTGKRIAPREAAELIIKIADAVHHAHEAGVVHRDLKPSNIMMDRKGEPYVIDFGLARREVGEMTVTIDGQVLGTPAYMPPEQACGDSHKADRRSDTYSLGVVLFRLLTGELPFRGQVRMLILQILDQQAPSPRQLDATIPRDLATITLKCLEKDPAKRYQTAADLAADLKRFLAGEPIKAREVGRTERVWRWAKRHPELASLSSLLFLTLLTAAIVAPIVAVRQTKLRHEAEFLRDESERDKKDLQNQVAHNLLQRASEEYNSGRILEGIALLAGAHDAAATNSSLRSSIRAMLSGWAGEGGQPLVFDDVVLTTSFSPDGNSAVIGGHNGSRTAQLWDLRTTTPFGNSLQHDNSVRAAAFSPDGSLVLTGSQDGTARLWNAKTGVPVGTMPNTDNQSLWSVAFSPDGDVFITGSKDRRPGGADNRARLWNTRTLQPIGAPLTFGSGIYATAILPDGRVVTGCVDGAIEIVATALSAPEAKPIELKLDGNVYAIAISPDHTKMLVGTGSSERPNENCARFFDIETLKPLDTLFPHDDFVYAIALSPDGRTALTGSFDNTARLWDIESQKPLGQPIQHGGWVMSVAFDPHGGKVFTGSADGTARLLDIREGRTLQHTDHNIVAMAINRQGDAIATGGDDGAVNLWNAQSGERFGASMLHDGPVIALAFGTDGLTLYTGSTDQKLRAWNANTGEPRGTPWELSGSAQRIEICDDGKGLLIQCETENAATIEFRDLASGTLLSEVLKFEPGHVPIAFDPNRRTVLVQSSGDEGKRVGQIWEIESGKTKGKPLLHPQRIVVAAFSADGETVVTGSYDQEVRVWNAESGEFVRAFNQVGVIKDVDIGHDCQTILSGGDDRKAQLWSLQSSAALGQPLQHVSKVAKVALSPDCQVALTIGEDGSARVWDTRTCKPIARPLQRELSRQTRSLGTAESGGPLRCIDGMFSANGSIIAFTCGDGTVRLYDIPESLPDDPRLVRLWARARSALTLDKNAVPQQLSQAEWLNAQSELPKLKKPVRQKQLQASN